MSTLPSGRWGRLASRCRHTLFGAIFVPVTGGGGLVPAMAADGGSTAQLDDRLVQSLVDYGTSVPNLGFAATGIGSAASRTISIRGISGDTVTGLYIDETPVPDSLDPDIVDVERIEVLPEPRETRYGACSTGGTVRLFAQQPHADAVAGCIGLTSSYTDLSTQGNCAVDGALNLPQVSDRLAVRAVGFYDSHAGWFRREFPSRQGAQDDSLVRDVTHANTYGGALSVAYPVTDSVTLTSCVMHQRSGYNGLPFADFFIQASGTYAFRPSDFVQRRQYDVPEGGHDEWNLYSLGLAWKAAYGSLVSLPCGFFYTADAGAAESKAFELEAHTRLWRALDLSAGIGYEHAVITGSGATSAQRPGHRVNQVPEWTANLSVTYTHDFYGGWKSLANVICALVGEGLSANNDPQHPRTRPSYALLDMHSRVSSAGHEIAAFASNLINGHANLANNRSIAAERPG